METIGILGGMGSYATLKLFERILNAFPADKEWERPRIIIDNNCIMPSRVRAILYHEKRDELIQQMGNSIKYLVEGGVTWIILGCITAHCFLDQLPHRDKIISIINETIKNLPQDKEIFILCTEGTREVGIWSQEMKKIRHHYPDDIQMKKIRGFIEAVKQNKVSDKVRDDFTQFVEDSDGDAVLLGCTELPVLAEGKKFKKIVYDPLQYLVNSLVERENKGKAYEEICDMGRL